MLVREVPCCRSGEAAAGDAAADAGTGCGGIFEGAAAAVVALPTVLFVGCSCKCC